MISTLISILKKNNKCKIIINESLVFLLLYIIERVDVVDDGRARAKFEIHTEFTMDNCNDEFQKCVLSSYCY